MLEPLRGQRKEALNVRVERKPSGNVKALIGIYEQDLEPLKTERRLRKQGTIVSTKAHMDRVLGQSFGAIGEAKHRLQACLSVGV
jgi:hypothetical protein